MGLELWLEPAEGCDVPPDCYAAVRCGDVEGSCSKLSPGPPVHCEPHEPTRLFGMNSGDGPAIVDIFQRIGSISIGQLEAGAMGEVGVPWPNFPVELTLRITVAEVGKPSPASRDVCMDDSSNASLDVCAGFTKAVSQLDFGTPSAPSSARSAAGARKGPNSSALLEQQLQEQPGPLLRRQSSFPRTESMTSEKESRLRRQASGSFSRGDSMTSDKDQVMLRQISVGFGRGHSVSTDKESIQMRMEEEEEDRQKLYKPVSLTNCNQILPFLYLGGVDAVADPHSVKQQGIRAIVCCLRELEFPSKEFVSDIEYYRVDVEDVSREPIELFWPEATEFIHSWISREQPVLVHCRAGVSRSASVVISYLVTFQGMSLHEAFFLVRSRRNVVTPNIGFMEKLCDYEEKRRGGDCTIDVNKYISWYSTPDSERAAVPDLIVE